MPNLVALDQTVCILGKSTQDWAPQEGLSWSPKPQGVKVIESHTLQSSTKCSVMQLEPRGSGRPNLLCSL